MAVVLNEPSPYGNSKLSIDYWRTIDDLECLGLDYFHYVARYLQSFSCRPSEDFRYEIGNDLFEFFYDVFDPTHWDEPSLEERRYIDNCQRYVEDSSLITELAHRIAELCLTLYQGILVPANFNPWEAEINRQGVLLTLYLHLIEYTIGSYIDEDFYDHDFHRICHIKNPVARF